MPRMGTYTQADADRDIAVHAALTTAIHGVGSLHVAGFGVAGQELSKIIWKDESGIALNDNNRTGLKTAQVLDLTNFTSERAKFAIVRLSMKADTIGTGPSCGLNIYKNGTTPNLFPRLILEKDHCTVGGRQYVITLIGLDDERTIIYAIDVGAGWQVDSDIDVLGFIE